MKTKLKYQVGELRAAGLEAKWSRNRKGAPVIVARWPGSPLRHQRNTWFLVDANMWHAMEQDGILAGFNGCTLIADIFSIPA